MIRRWCAVPPRSASGSSWSSCSPARAPNAEPSVRRWLLGLGLCCAACGSTPTAPIGDRAPYDFSFDDPAGDTLAVVTLPPDAGPAVDLVKVSGHVASDVITLNLDF